MIPLSQNKLLQAWIKLDGILQTEEEEQEHQKKPTEKRLMPKKKLLIIDRYNLQKKNTQKGSRPIDDARDIKDIRDLREGNYSSALRTAIPTTNHLRPRGESAASSRRPGSSLTNRGRQPTPAETSKFNVTFDKGRIDKSNFLGTSMMQTTLRSSRITPIRVRVLSQSEQMNMRYSPKSKYQNLETVIHSVQVPQIEEIYKAKCQDNKNDFNQNQLKHFIDKFNANCKKRVLFLEEQSMGPQAGIKIAEILEDNRHFVRVLMSKNFTGDRGAKAIAEALRFNDYIIHLDLSSNNIGPEGSYEIIEMLIHNKTLISLKLNSYEGLNRNRIDAQGMKPTTKVLELNQTLQFLDLSGSSISAEGLGYLVEGLKNNQTLISLNLSNNDLNQNCCLSLAKAIASSNLQELLIADNKLYDTGVLNLLTMFTKLVEFPAQLETLDISGNKITNAGASKIFDQLIKNSSLKKIIMNNNPLNGKNFQTLINFLWDNGSVAHLSLENCMMGSEGGDAIAVGLTKNRYIEELHIGKNRFGDNSMKALVKGLMESIRIKVVDINGCKIMDEGGRAFCELIRTNNSIHTYDFRDNQFYDDTGMFMAEAVKENKRVKRIALDRNPMAFKYVDDIKKSVQANIDEVNKHLSKNFAVAIVGLKEIESTKHTVNKQVKDTEDAKEEAQVELNQQKDEFEEVKKEEQVKYDEVEAEYDTYWKEGRRLEQEYVSIKDEIRALELQISQEQSYMDKNADRGAIEAKQIHEQFENTYLKWQKQKKATQLDIEKAKKELKEIELKNDMLQAAVDATQRQVDILKDNAKQQLKKGLLDFQNIGNGEKTSPSQSNVGKTPAKIDRDLSNKKIAGDSKTNTKGSKKTKKK